MDSIKRNPEVHTIVSFGISAFYKSITVTPRAACAPITRACSISAVLEGPLMKVPKLYFGSISIRVDLLIWQKTDLGFKVIIDNQYPGLLYQDQIFQYIHTGDKMKGYIGRVRPDGKIDVTLQKTGIQQTADFAETLYQYLLDNDGECNLGDKSEADEIYERFHVSKKVYKRAVGDLYKKRLITVSPMSIRLAE